MGTDPYTYFFKASTRYYDGRANMRVVLEGIRAAEFEARRRWPFSAKPADIRYCERLKYNPIVVRLGYDYELPVIERPCTSYDRSWLRAAFRNDFIKHNSLVLPVEIMPWI